MAKALNTVDGVGIAHLATREPHLPNDFLEGILTGVIKSLLDETDIGLTNVGAETHIQ
jgi:hypothetical protein